jgi:hypothetical protein
MKMRCGVLALMAAATVQVAPADAKNCEVPSFPTADNQTATGRMTVKTGKRCMVRMGVSVAGFANAKIIKPERGSIEIRGYEIVYTPKKGYLGRDTFNYARDNLDRWGNKAVRTVDMDVNVVQ